jgi:SAM-dependent methyltransferase
MKIEACRACGKEELLPIMDLGNQFINGFPRQPDPERRPRSPLVLALCRNCELLQLLHSIDADLLFRQYWYRSGMTQSMRNELREIVDQGIHESGLVPGDSVLDIGANDGTLLRNYPEGVYTFGFEPARNLESLAVKGTSEIVPEYFSAALVSGGRKFKVITAIAMFYDLEDPRSFLRDVASVLSDDGVFIVQQNYAPKMIEGNAFDNVCHEHLCYYSLRSFLPLLEGAGLRVFAVSFNDTNGGSFRVFASKNKRESWPARDVMIEWEESRCDVTAIIGFAGRIDRIKKAVMEHLLGFENPYLCGASTRGNTLLQSFGITHKIVRAAGERDPRKHGRYTVGSWIPIVSEEEMRAKADCLLVLPWHFRAEIVDREREFIEDGGSVIFPLPEPELVTGRGIKRL